jgi:dihydrofolate reductase
MLYGRTTYEPMESHWPAVARDATAARAHRAWAVKALKDKTPDGVLVGSPKLSFALEELGLIDEYRIVVHPVLAGHGPTLFEGLGRSRPLTLVSTKTLGSGVIATHLRRKHG